jgi:Bacterial protein of unknown function (DUF885)
MMKIIKNVLLGILFTILITSASNGEERVTDSSDLVSLFREFREFTIPNSIEIGVPDYTAATMQKQWQELKTYQKRLVAIDTSDWPISKKVDYQIVRAEMNAVEFNHRVLRPWSKDPGFYSVIPRFEQNMYGAIIIPKLPLSEDKIEDFQVKLRAIPKVLEQAKENLTEAASDLAILAIKRNEKDSNKFRNLIEKLSNFHSDLVPDAKKALAAMDDFRAWIEQNLNKMTAPAGVGIDNYNWYLKNVQLVPYTWEEAMVLLQREYEQAMAVLHLEKNRNRKIPILKPASSAGEYIQRFNNSQEFLLNFLKKEKILTVPDYLVLNPLVSFKLPQKPHDFFQQCMIRDPLALMPHDFIGHHLDTKRHGRDSRPIRGTEFHIYGRRYQFIDAFRSEGLATAVEEILMHAGMLDQRPRSREIICMLRIFRAVRAIADLKMHNNQLSFNEAAEFCAEKTPYCWSRADSDLIWGDLELYLCQPAYGIGYTIGKIQIEKLLADKAAQLGDDFIFGQFMDEFLAAGMIPISLTRWEMTGLEDEIKKLW